MWWETTFLIFLKCLGYCFIYFSVYFQVVSLMSGVRKDWNTLSKRANSDIAICLGYELVLQQSIQMWLCCSSLGQLMCLYVTTFELVWTLRAEFEMPCMVLWSQHRMQLNEKMHTSIYIAFRAVLVLALVLEKIVCSCVTWIMRLQTLTVNFWSFLQYHISCKVLVGLGVEWCSTKQKPTSRLKTLLEALTIKIYPIMVSEWLMRELLNAVCVVTPTCEILNLLYLSTWCTSLSLLVAALPCSAKKRAVFVK